MLRSSAAGFFRRSQQASLQCLQVRFAETQVSKNQIDWDALQDFVTSDEGKRELSALRSSYIELEGQARVKKASAIDWEQYKGSIEPQTLELFRKAYTGLKFPNYDPSKDIQEAKASFKPLYEQADELAAFSEKRLKEIDQELKAIETEKEKMLKLTIDEELANHPEIAKEIDKEISEGNFLP